MAERCQLETSCRVPGHGLHGRKCIAVAADSAAKIKNTEPGPLAITVTMTSPMPYPPDAASMARATPRSTGPLILKRASASRLSGQWKAADFDVLAHGVVVGRILKANASPVGSSWIWALAFGYHEDRTPTDGFAETREAAMAAFAKSWRRE